MSIVILLKTPCTLRKHVTYSSDAGSKKRMAIVSDFKKWQKALQLSPVMRKCIISLSITFI